MSDRKLRIGMVSPYGWDTPGGVQIHIKDLAENLIAQGHEVSVLAPVSDESQVHEKYLVSAGRPVSIPYNGAVARILFGPVASSRVKQWIAAGDFDLLHVHEPAIPSLSLLACWAAEGPIVATFHAAAAKQRAIYAIGPILEPMLEKLTAKIAVSEMARATLKDHFETEAVVIPNGIDTTKFKHSQPNPNWATPHTIGFIGRFEEPRKGLDILLRALPHVAREFPDVKLLVAGPGDITSFTKKLPLEIMERTEFLGLLTDEEKSAFFKSVAVYVAPNTGGESFGIILAEAMASSTPILASDIPAFDQLLGHGRDGVLFTSENVEDLSMKLTSLLGNVSERERFQAAGYLRAQDFDWKSVSDQILDVYEMVLVGNTGVTLGSENRVWNRIRNNG